MRPPKGFVSCSLANFALCTNCALAGNRARRKASAIDGNRARRKASAPRRRDPKTLRVRQLLHLGEPQDRTGLTALTHRATCGRNG